MNYAYDILLNFQKELYDFYEWNQEDIIKNIRKIPVFRIKNKDFHNIKNNKIKIEKTFLKKIYKKTEYYNEEGTTNIKYACLFTNGKEVIGITSTNEGIINYKSSLLIDEMEEILNTIKKEKPKEINYTILKKEKHQFKTRFEMENKKYVISEIKKAYKEKNFKKINYIYLECFRKEELNIKKAINALKKEIIKENDNFYKIYNVLKTQIKPNH